jgi:hypothetical protein
LSLRILYPVTNVKTGILAPIKSLQCDWSNRRLNLLRLNKNWNINLEILFLIYPFHSFSDNLQSLLCLNVPQILTTSLELHSSKCQESIICIPGVSHTESRA